MKYYVGTGGGTGAISKKAEEAMKEIVRILAEKGYCLRTGDEKVDSLFVSFAKEIGAPMEVFFTEDLVITENIKQDALKNYYGYRAINASSKKNIARCYYEVLGDETKEDNQRSDLVICYDIGKGSVNYGARLAKRMGIPVYNLYDKENLNSMLEEIRNLRTK